MIYGFELCDLGYEDTPIMAFAFEDGYLERLMRLDMEFCIGNC